MQSTHYFPKIQEIHCVFLLKFSLLLLLHFSMSYLWYNEIQKHEDEICENFPNFSSKSSKFFYFVFLC